jgi:alpha-D-ribose 1-methylphosphonate 5-triphosphate diphosphatase
MSTPHAHSASLLLTNATLVLPDAVRRGTVCVTHGVISDIASSTTAAPQAIDCQGDLILPGLVELHTDNLEKHAVPRPQVRWPMLAAVLAHDAELAAAGITTVCNGITVGAVLTDSVRSQIVDDSIDTLI